MNWNHALYGSSYAAFAGGFQLFDTGELTPLPMWVSGLEAAETDASWMLLMDSIERDRPSQTCAARRSR